MDTQPEVPRGGRSSLPLFIGIAAAVAAVIAYFAFGMPGMDHSMSDMSGMSGGSNNSASLPQTRTGLLIPSEFEDVMADPDVFVMNVHVPAAESRLDGTDLEMPYNKIDPELIPADRSTPLAVYCRSGSMSADAVEQLRALGYTNIAELDGGTNAWRASGRSLSDTASN